MPRAASIAWSPREVTAPWPRPVAPSRTAECHLPSCRSAPPTTLRPVLASITDPERAIDKWRRSRSVRVDVGVVRMRRAVHCSSRASAWDCFPRGSLPDAKACQKTRQRSAANVTKARRVYSSRRYGRSSHAVTGSASRARLSKRNHCWSRFSTFRRSVRASACRMKPTPPMACCRWWSPTRRSRTRLRIICAAGGTITGAMRS